jgi:hypothetical protein
MNSIHLLKAAATVGAALITLIGMTGCPRRVPSFTVVLVDPSASVTARARADEFAAVGALIPTMQRGDSLIIIPITGNAKTDIAGRTLRLHAPEHRETYDSDLRRFREEAAKRYADFSRDLLSYPGTRTDILGSLDAASQELSNAPAQSQKRLVVLSDFIEDDRQYHFSSAAELADAPIAAAFARTLRRQRRFSIQSIVVHLGALGSDEYAALAPDREAAIRAFWRTYLASDGQATDIAPDGMAILQTPSR